MNVHEAQHVVENAVIINGSRLQLWLFATAAGLAHGYVVAGTAPDSFKNLEVFPSIKDVHDDRQFLRPNKIIGTFVVD